LPRSGELFLEACNCYYCMFVNEILENGIHVVTSDATALHQASSGSSIVRQDAVTRDRRYGPLMAKRSEEEEVVTSANAAVDVMKTVLFVCLFVCVFVCQ